MFKYVTCAAVRIVFPGDAPSMIDHAIRSALRERKPAYIEIACNLSAAPCPEPGPYEAITAREESGADAMAGAVDRRPPCWREEAVLEPGRTCAALTPRRGVPRRRRRARLRRR